MSLILDISRTVSRVDSGAMTGIDRVERAYINHSLTNFPQARYLAKVGRRYALLDAQGIRHFLDHSEADSWPKAGGLDVFRTKLSPRRRRVRTFLRRKSLAYGDLDSALRNAVRQSLYINVGHTNLSKELFQSLKNHKVQESWVMVHDMIPLDHPEFTRTDTIDRFKSRMHVVSGYADTIICNSNYTQERVQYWFDKFGRVPKTKVAYLGIESEFRQKQPRKSKSGRPKFLVLGTIEPRKNHQLLLDVWEQLAQELPESEVPILEIVGRRGWQNDKVFKILDQSNLVGRFVFEFSDLPDRELQTKMASTSALLFPSKVEGFGLPALEAAAQGLPIICSDIPVFRELLGEYPEYLPPNDTVVWKKFVAKAMKSDNRNNILLKTDQNAPTIHTWDAHFEIIFKNSKDVQT